MYAPVAPAEMIFATAEDTLMPHTTSEVERHVRIVFASWAPSLVRGIQDIELIVRKVFNLLLTWPGLPRLGAVLRSVSEDRGRLRSSHDA